VGEIFTSINLLETVEEYVKNTFRKDKVKENQEHTFIVLQEITGTTDKYRLHACLTDSKVKNFFSDILQIKFY
jgi:hypothetical protein